MHRFVLALLVIPLVALGPRSSQADEAVEITASALETIDIDLDPVGTNGLLGIEFNAPSTNTFTTYSEMLRWDTEGEWMTFDTNESSPTFFQPTGVIDGPRAEAAATWLRLEAYPSTAIDCVGDDPTDECYWNYGYRAFDERHGGFHVQLERAAGDPWPTVGRVIPPTLNDEHGGFLARGGIVSSIPIDDDRLQIDVFQIDCSVHEECVSPPVSPTGVTYGAFATGTNRSDIWAAGVLWPGRYMVYVEDRAAGVKVQGIVDVAAGPLPTLDLDAPCFAMPVCVTVPGFDEPAAAQSGFHPMAPVRLLDTRTGLGIAEGPMSPGDGRLDDPNPWNRADATRAHELKVTGAAGIPESGVAAVLLNVTVVDPVNDGFLTVGPRPAGRGEVFDDQNSYAAWPSSSNLNIRTGETAPNMVLVRVGAGGKIRFHLDSSTAHILADVAGWFSSVAPEGPVAGFTGVAPQRLLDTRIDPEGALSPGESRRLVIAGSAGVPAGAEAVVLNVTAAEPAARGFVTIHPSGNNPPNVSNLNLSPGVTRANLVVIALGGDGGIDLRTELSSTHLIVDIFGYFQAQSGEMTTVADPFRVADTRTGTGTDLRPLSSGEIRRVQIAGVGDIPSHATAAYLNLTVTQPVGAGFLTAWPAGSPPPIVSNLNWSAGQTIPNMAVIPLSEDGSIDLRVDLPWDPSGTAEVLVDVLGWVS